MSNNLLSEKLVYTGTSRVRTHLHICTYDRDGVASGSGRTWSEVAETYRPGKVNFIQVHGLCDTAVVADVCGHLGIGLLVQQDILNVGHPPKVEQHDTFNFVVMKRIVATGGELEPRHVCIVQGQDYVIVFVEDDTEFFTDVVTAINDDAFKVRMRQSDYLLSVLMNSVITAYVATASDMMDDLENVEEKLLSLANDEVDISDLQAYRRKYLMMKKAIMPLKDQMARLSYSQNPLTHKANRPFWSDVGDHLSLSLQLVESLHETLSSLVELYVSNNDLRMNNIMKRLTIVSTIFIPLTFLAGIWGMNFADMPELDWRYGYLMAWVLMVGIGVAIYFYLKRKGWY